MRRLIKHVCLPAAVFFLLTNAAVLAQSQTVGLFEYDTASFTGYTLFAPMSSTTTYLLDNYGRSVHTWEDTNRPANSVYLLENGNLLRTTHLFGTRGAGGGVTIFDWDGAVLWDYVYFNENHLQHHDIEPLPNGNVLILAWEHISAADAIAAGRDPALLDSAYLSPEHIVEVEPTGLRTGNIVWEWHLLDHLIQDFDSTKENYGDVTGHPELVNINFALNGHPDWIHANAIDYNPDLDQIVISCHHLNEIWIIDHSTTTAEAAGHSGGSGGRGGDILYRWGNPQVYRAGTEADQKLFGQHDAHWIEPGLSGEGNIMIYNNGRGRPEGNYSTINEIITPLDGKGNYPRLTRGTAYGPTDAVWSYVADPPTSLYSNILSGAQRLPNGNTLICLGRPGRFLEITPVEEIVWEYINPVTANGPLAQGDTLPPGSNFVFRATRYAPDYPGFRGHSLLPGSTPETYPITVSGTSHSPVDPGATDPVVVTTWIYSDAEPALVELNIDTGNDFWTTAMKLDSAIEGIGYLYEASVLPLIENTEVSYYIYVETDTGSYIYDPPNAPSIAYRYSVGGGVPYVCGDANADASINVGDPVYLINYIFKDGPGPQPHASGDANCDGTVDVGDAVTLINYIFKGGIQPCESCL
jgi:hypothetical protein